MESEQQLQQLKQLQIQLQQLELQIQLQQQESQKKESAPTQEQPPVNEESQQTQDKAEPEPKQPTQSTPSDPQPQEQKAPPKTPEIAKESSIYFEPPKALSTIQVGFLRNLLSANLLAVKQYRQAAQNSQLPDLKCQFEEAGQLHLSQYDKLLTLLEGNGGSAQ